MEDVSERLVETVHRALSEILGELSNPRRAAGSLALQEPRPRLSLADQSAKKFDA